MKRPTDVSMEKKVDEISPNSPHFRCVYPPPRHALEKLVSKIRPRGVCHRLKLISVYGTVRFCLSTVASDLSFQTKPKGPRGRG